MKILLVHNAYQQWGGEDTVFEQELALLRDAGQQVATYRRSNQEMEDYGLFDRLALARNTVWSEESRRDFYLYMDEFQNFVSLDIADMLDQVRKFGLFTVLSHQRFGQLDDNITDAVLTNCRIKAVFGGLTVESAQLMARSTLALVPA